MLQNSNFESSTLEEKLYELILTALDGTRLADDSYRDHLIEIVKKGVGGFVISGGVKEQVKSSILFLQSCAKAPLIIASRIERGVGAVIKGATVFPSRMAYEASINRYDPGNIMLLRRILTVIASEASDCGINTRLISDVDTHGKREYSVPNEGVDSQGAANDGWLESESVEVFRAMGILSCEELSGERADAAGTGRECLIAAPAPGISIPYFRGNADMFLDPGDPDGIVKNLIRAIETSEITEKEIDRALAKIGAAKTALGEARSVETNYVRNEELSHQIAQKAITLVKGHGRFLPIRDSDNIPLVYAGDTEYFQNSPLRYYVKQASHVSKPLPAKERPAMFLIFGDVMTDNGTAHIGSQEVESIRRLVRSNSPAIVVSFGSPYVLEHFKEADILVAAYDATDQAQEAVFKCITGERYFQGQLPVKLIV